MLVHFAFGAWYGQEFIDCALMAEKIVIDSAMRSGDSVGPSCIMTQISTCFVVYLFILSH